jgi:LPS-assembly protein
MLSPVLMDLAALHSALWPKALALLLSLAPLAISEAVATQQQPSPGATARAEDRTTAISQADSQTMDKQTLHLRGHVEITYRAINIHADDATIDETSGDVSARGHVLFIDPISHIAAEEVHYNLRTHKGWFANSLGYVHPKVRPRARILTTQNPFYFQAARVERLDEDTYVAENARLSSCECQDKGWSVSARQARVEVDHRLVTHDAMFRLLRVPVFFAPVLVNSLARNARQTGFLLPQIGNSSQKGFIFGDGFFWAINPSADLTVGVQDYSIRGPAFRGIFNARPSTDSEIFADYFRVNDRGSGPLRQSKAPGQSLLLLGKANDLGYGFRGVLDVDYITSLAFRLTFSETFAQAVTSEVHQMGFLTKNFDAYSINLYMSRYQNFFSTAPGPGNSVAIRETPSLSFSGIDKQVGRTPFYFSFESSAGVVGRSEPDLTLPTSERLDAHPQITLRSRPFWGFQFTPAVGARVTRYGTSLMPGHNPLDRVLGEFSLDLRPPSLEKVLSKKYAGYRIKHVIEPDIQYRLVRIREPENVVDAVRYDYVDIFAQTNEVEYSLTNTLLARKDVPNDTGEKPQAREVFSLRLSQKYYFDPTFGGAVQPGTRPVFDPTISLTGFAFPLGRRLSPVVTVAKFAPFSNYDTELRADLSPSGEGVLNAGITSHVRRGPLGVAFTDFFINRTAGLSTPIAPSVPLSQLPSFHLFRTVASYGDVNHKGLSGALGLDYNLVLKTAHQVVSQVSYNFGCFGLDFEYRRFALGPLRREHQFRVALSLANVGTFGNLKRRERLY